MLTFQQGVLPSKKDETGYHNMLINERASWPLHDRFGNNLPAGITEICCIYMTKKI